MNRSEILDQLTAGQLSADEAARLLRDSPATREPAPAHGGSEPGYTNRRLRVRVSNLDTGRDRVNVNLPLALVEAGMRLGARFEPQIHGIDLSEVFDQIRAGTDGLLVDAENWEDGERVEVFIE